MCVTASSIRGLHNKSSSFVIIVTVCNFLDPLRCLSQTQQSMFVLEDTGHWGQCCYVAVQQVDS